MSNNSGKGKGTLDSDLEDYKYKYYEELKKGIFKIEVSNSAYRCPFCVRGRDYSFERLLGHALKVGRELRHTIVHEKACHLALEKYMKRMVTSESLSRHERHHHYQGCQSPPDDQLFVHPWKGVIANIPREFKDGKYAGSSLAKLKEELKQKGFNPQKLHPLWNKQGFSGFAIVDFVKEMDGLHHALKFERSFEVKRHGRMEFYASRNVGEKLYGWVARRDDYHSSSLVGDHLLRNGDLKTVSGIQQEDKRRTFNLVRGLTESLKAKNLHIKEIQNKCEKAEISIDAVMEEKEKMTKSYNDEMKRMQQNAYDHLERISLEHERARLELMNHGKDLQQRENELLRRESLDESERRRILREKEMIKLQHEKEMNERATAEQRKADEDLLKLAEKHKKEKEELHKKSLALVKKLDGKEALELEIEQIKGALGVMKHMDREDDTEIKKKMEELQEELEERKDELEFWESTNQTLIIKEQKINEELVDARKELITCLKESTGRADIGVKQTGGLEGNACHSKKVGKKPFKGVDEGELELWNFKEERPATIREGILHVLRQFRLYRRKR